jgi:hypothetical protein
MSWNPKQHGFVVGDHITTENHGHRRWGIVTKATPYILNVNFTDGQNDVCYPEYVEHDACGVVAGTLAALAHAH